MSSSRVRLGTGQIILVALATTVLAALSISSFTASNRALSNATQANSASTQSTAIIITQRETLVYTIRFSEWLRGTTTRRELQISRALLAQRLEVIDSTGVSIGSRARPTYLAALKASDELLASAVPGILPANLQKEFQARSVSIIDTLIEEGHRMIDDYSRTVASQIQGFAQSQQSASTLNFYLLIVLTTLLIILLSWTAIRVREQYRKDRIRIQMEAEHLKETREELVEARETVKALTNLNEAKNEFVSTINHELRTPLTSIIGYVEILKDLSSSEHNGEFHKYLEVVDKNATVLLDLIESVLLLSSLDTVETQKDLKDLVKICENSISVLKFHIEAEDLRVEIQMDKNDQFIVQGNRGQLSQVFINLISNAVKFSPYGSTIVIKLSRVVDDQFGDRVRVDVCDEGIGIPSSEVGQLFSRFFRASNAAESQIPGSGLGLAIVQKIVALHFGEISVKSSVGVGTTMSVVLPVLLSPVEKLVLERREGVLERAITAISMSSSEELMETCHEYGGSIGFYTFLDEGTEVLNFSRWLRLTPDLSEVQIHEQKEALLSMLSESLVRFGTR